MFLNKCAVLHSIFNTEIICSNLLRIVTNTGKLHMLCTIFSEDFKNPLPHFLTIALIFYNYKNSISSLIVAYITK